jgi:hypothetical protein
MAQTLLQSVNEIFRRVGIIAGDAGELTSLTDSPRQPAIDVAVQAINEGVDDLYMTSDRPMPNEQAESAITLANGDRDYALASDLVQMRFPLIDKTNNQFITDYPGGYNQILIDDSEQDDTGLPHMAAIRPTDGQLYLDRAPTTIEAGRVYTYQYDKDLVLSVAADTVPFKDIVFRAMVPVWVQIWKREMRNEFDGELYNHNLGRACGALTQKHARTSWNPH